MSKSYHVAIVGTGKIVNSHVHAIQSAGDRVELVAAVDINEAAVQKFCSDHSVPNAYTSVTEMLAQEKPDLVCVATPPISHKDLCVEILDAGAWVYCEKPLCGSLAEFDAITQAEESSGCYASTVFQWRFGSAVKHLRKLIQAESLGKALVVTCNTLWYRNQDYYDVSWRGKYATEFGGPTMGLGIHIMDLCLYFLDDWQKIQADIDTLDRNMEIEDISMAMVRFENGAMGSFINSALSPRQETYLRMDFQKATAEVTALYRASNENWRFSIPEKSEDTETLALWNALDVDFKGSHDQQFSEILDSMDKNERPLVSGDEARRILEFTASLYKSAVTGKVVSRGDITSSDLFYYSNNPSEGVPEQS